MPVPPKQLEAFAGHVGAALKRRLDERLGPIEQRLADLEELVVALELDRVRRVQETRAEVAQIRARRRALRLAAE